MGSNYTWRLSLFGLTWRQAIPSPSVTLDRTDRILLPSYEKTLTTMSELALVCGLSLSDVLKAGALGKASLMPYAPTEGFKLQRIDRQKLNNRIIAEGLRESGPDWLGRYYHGSDMPERIELHLSRCQRVARFLSVSARELVQVILTHEAAHFVSHIGIGGFNHSIWESFSNASSDEKEHIAQAASWVTFSVFARPRLNQVMEKLATHQSEKYNSWRVFEKDCRDCNANPLQIIEKLTLQVGRISGRKVESGREDIHNIVGYDE